MINRMENITRTFDARAGSYDIESRWVRAIEVIDPLVPTPMPDAEDLLDICAGTGSVSDIGFARGWNVVALDRTYAMLARQQNPQITKVCASAERLPFLDQEFDLVVNRQGLHYLDAELAIREMLRVSKCDIRIGQITMFDASDFKIWNEYFSVVSPGRKHIFSPGDISTSVRAAGGRVTACDVIITTDEFDGPIMHLGTDCVSAMRDLFLRAPAPFRTKYLRTAETDSSFELVLRWEFVQAARG